MSPAAGFTRGGRPERDGDGGAHEPDGPESGGPTVPENGGREA